MIANQNSTVKDIDTSEAFVSDSAQAYEADDQRVHKIEDSYIAPTSSVITKQNPYLMTETFLSSSDMFKNPVVVDTISWVADNTPGQIIATFQIPEVFTTIQNFQRAQLSLYAYFKMSPRLRFQLNSTKFHQGRIICFYDPFDAMAPTSFKQATIYAATGQPNVLLDASLSNTGELSIPFEHLVSYLTTNSASTYPPMGTVNVMVLNQLKTTGGTNNVTIQVLLSCDDVELHLPIAPHTPTVTFEAQSGKIKEVMAGATSALTSGISAFGSMASGNFGKAFQSGGKAIGSIGTVLSAFDLDKPTRVDPTSANCLSTYSALTHMVGPDDSTRLDTVQVGGYYDHPLYSSAPPSETKIIEIIKTKMLAQVFNWSTTQVPGTVLVQIPIYPRYANTSSVTIAGNDYQQMNPTFLSYLATFFRYWRGSISYRMDFISTQFHTGRLAVIFIPNNDLEIPDNLSLLTNYPTRILDVHEQKSFDFAAPFVSATPRKEVFLQEAHLVPGTSLSDLNITGFFQIVVYTQLTAPSTVADNIDVNIYVGAGEDFELDVPIGAPGFCFRPPPTSTLIEEDEEELFEAQSATDPVPLRSEDRFTNNFSGKQTSLVSPLNSFNNQVVDVRDLGRRFCYLQTGVMTFAGVNTQPTPWAGGPAPVPDGYYAFTGLAVTPLARVDNEFPSLTTTETRAVVWSDIVSRLYALWSGSIRYKIIIPATRNQGVILGARVTPSFVTYDSQHAAPLAPVELTSFPVHITNTAQNVTMDIEIPYMSPYNQLLVTSPYPDGVDQHGPPQLCSPTALLISARASDVTTLPGGSGGGTAFFNAKFLVAMGDDFALSFLVAPPDLYYYPEQD